MSLSKDDKMVAAVSSHEVGDFEKVAGEGGSGIEVMGLSAPDAHHNPHR